RAKDVAAVIRRFGDLFEPSHRAHGQEDEAADEDGEDDDEEVDDDDEEMHEASEDQSEDDESVPRFSIDSPGHPDLNFAALLALGLADEAVFAKASQSEQVFRHYFPVIRRFWAMFQDELDNDTPVPAAFRKANQDGAVKKSSIGLIANVVYRLAEARLLLIADDAIMGDRPTADSEPSMSSRWEYATMLRSNERKTLSQCIKTYKKIATKLS
ncbi:hypothetical protein GGI21_002629, partial [Coemansia aciculifera]